MSFTSIDVNRESGTITSNHVGVRIVVTCSVLSAKLDTMDSWSRGELGWF